MTLFRKPAVSRKGAKVLIVGKSGTGKTSLGLTFPGIMVIDTENGMTFYEGTETGKNVLGVANTQSFYDVEDAIDEVSTMGDEAKTLLIDSETKVYENTQHTVQRVDNARARRDGRDLLDTNLSIRSWGKINEISKRLQNKKIDLSSRGVNVVSVAQIKDVTEEIGGNMIVTGYRIEMPKNSEYDYDIVLETFTEGEGENVKYKTKVLKDRTKTYKAGDVIDNASYNLWKERIENGEKPSSETTYSETKDDERYAQEVDKESKTVPERMKEVVQSLDEKEQKELKEELTKNKISSLNNLTANETKKVKEILDKFEK